MKVAIVIFVIGDKYIHNFNQNFRKSVTNYCNKYNYDLIILDKYISNEDMELNTQNERKKFFWQRLLIPDKFNNYDYVVSMDSDIYINPNSPPLPLEKIPEGLVGAVNERKYMGNYEWRENIQKLYNWEKTGIDWYALSGEKKDYNDHINGGLVIYQPKYHAELMKNLYKHNINNYLKYHQDDQSILSSYLIDNKMIYWLDERYNRIWFYWKNIFYPNFDMYNIYLKKMFIQNFINLNYFTHFTSHMDIEFI